MKAELVMGRGSGHEVSEMILGHNIEMCLGTANGLLSERLRNPKFLGPSHPMTNIAPHWMGTTYGSAAYELTPFGGMAGSEAQLVRVTNTPGPCHLVQNKIQVREGEELELEIWARCWHKPVTLCAKLLPLVAHSREYDSGEVVIDKPYFSRYTVPLTAARDDDEARLQLQVVGEGEIWFDQVHLRPKSDPHLCRAVVATMADMRIPSLRFPGGIVVNAYHWKHGTGPVHLRPSALDAAFHHDWYLNYDFGLDEYLRFCADNGVVPALTLNIATETPDDAGEMALYCAEWFSKEKLDPPLVYWHVGNHPYGGTTAGMTAEMYADAVCRFAQGVKSAYPHSRIVAAMSWRDLAAKPQDAPWREALFEKASGLIDVIEAQKYGGCNPGHAPEDQLDQVANVLADVEPNINAFVELCRSRDVDWKVGIAEWNWWMQASHWDGREFEEPPSVLQGLFIAGMIKRLAAIGLDLEVAHFYNLVNCMGIITHRGADVQVSDMVKIFNLYRPALPGRYVPIEFSDNNDCIEALLLENDDGRWIFLTNRSATEMTEVALPDDFGSASCVCFAGSAPMHRSFEIGESRLSGTTVNLPPLSIVRIKI